MDNDLIYRGDHERLESARRRAVTDFVFRDYVDSMERQWDIPEFSVSGSLVLVYPQSGGNL